MPHTKPPMRWAPRVPRAKIRQLYATDALGIVDEELIDEVSFAIYAQSIRRQTHV